MISRICCELLVYITLLDQEMKEHVVLISLNYFNHISKFLIPCPKRCLSVSGREILKSSCSSVVSELMTPFSSVTLAHSGRRGL